ncbi:LacI family DNA-binding transcriptional regulator [Tessaracoccus defluvii]|uniref:LacI family DNA-binding transcriptional regulator n=1 Tax=Tessaracoccus defluvii TaxID=1285901 RepID=UPI0031E1AD7A
MSTVPRPGRPVTIRDVAQRAGVSHQTVSRYLRADATVRESYRDAIAAAIADLDYQPNLAARAMRTRHTGRMAVLLPEGPTASSGDVLRGVSGAVREAGFTVDVVALGGSPDERRRRALDLLGSGLFEGVLALTPLGLPAPGAGAPTVVEFPLYDDDLHGIGELATAAPIRELVARLAAAGHRGFLHLAGSYEHESACARRDAYLTAVAELGLDDRGVVECHWDPAVAMHAVADLPADGGVTAVIAANDLLALGAVRGAIGRGWRVPEDLSVTGFDTGTVAGWTTPALTSVAIDHTEVGRRAGASLLRALGLEPTEAAAPLMSPVWRESTGPAAHAY